MKFNATTALALVAAVSAVPAAAQSLAAHERQRQQEQKPGEAPPAQPAAASVKPSAKALKAIIELQDAVNKKDTANIPAKLAAAQAVATTKEDRYLIGQLQLKAAVGANDNNGAAAAVDAIASSGFLDSAKVSGLYTALGAQFYNAKDYGKAANEFGRAVALAPTDPEAVELLGQAQRAQGQGAQAASSFMKALQLRNASGQKAAEDVYKQAVSTAYEAQSPLAVDIGRQWIAAYPSALSWRNAIAIYRNYNKPDVEGTLDLLRLMRATSALSSPGDYRLYSTAAAEQLNYNEAQTVLNEGIAAKVVDPANADFRDVISGLKGKPKATAADLAIATKTAQNGTALLRIGDRYAAMGDYTKAVEAYRLSIGKPGVDTAVANLHIGMALARAGDKAGATAALNAVSGPRADIAKYWLLYVQQRS
jgi:tetratricopeptide (TPR) repeat protein